MGTKWEKASYGKWTPYFKTQLNKGIIQGIHGRDGTELYREDLMSDVPALTTITGGRMHQQKELFIATAEELRIAKREMQDTLNETRATMNALEPLLLDNIERVRRHRMAVLTEMNKSLTMLKDVRKFFLDKEHKEEIARLKELIELSERLRSLTKDGTMEAVTDIIIKLMEGPDERKQGTKKSDAGEV